MSKIKFADRSFTAAGLQVIADVERICGDYARQGYELTLRGLYYQLIAHDLFPDSRAFQIPGSDAYTKNVTRNYKWLSDLVSEARIAGLIDWLHITDTTRVAGGGDSGWDSPEDMLHSASTGYGITHWDGQPEYVEVWVEKEALIPVIRQAAGTWDVASFACKGSPSTSAMYQAAMRLRRQEQEGRKTTVIYLGDHDPTGIDISRDVQDRLALFRSTAYVDRIALNMDQVIALNPPPSPVKVTDSRTNGYIEQFGTDECWELDAIDPPTLDALVQDAIRAHLVMNLRVARLDREEHERTQLTAVYENWDSLLAWMQTTGLVENEEG